MMEYVQIGLSHWPFILASAVLYALNEGIKATFPSPEERKAHRVIWQLLPLWPILLGAAFGAISGSPLPVAVREHGSLSGPLYYAGAGFLAIYGRDLYVTFCKYRKGSA